MSSSSVEYVVPIDVNLRRVIMPDQPILLSNLARGCQSKFKFVYPVEAQGRAKNKATSIKLEAEELEYILRELSNGKGDIRSATVRINIAGHLAGLLYRTLVMCADLDIDPMRIIQQKEAGQL